jgi:hypothetical protein
MVPKGTYFTIGGVGEFTDAEIWVTCRNPERAFCCARRRIAMQFGVPVGAIELMRDEIVFDGEAKRKEDANNG